MAGLTKEQRAAKAALQEAAKALEESHGFDGQNVLMERDGKVTEVANNESVNLMIALGWKLHK